jgi:hypothetical protein
LASQLLVQAATILDHARLLLDNQLLLTFLGEAGLMSGGHGATVPPHLVPFVPTRRPIVRLLLRLPVDARPVFDRLLLLRALLRLPLLVRLLPLLHLLLLIALLLLVRRLRLLLLRLPLLVRLLPLLHLLLLIALPLLVRRLRLLLLLIPVLREWIIVLRNLKPFGRGLRRSFLFLSLAGLPCRFGVFLIFGLLVGLGLPFVLVPLLCPYRRRGPKK